MKTGFTQRLGADKDSLFSSLSAPNLWVNLCIILVASGLGRPNLPAAEYPEPGQRDFVIRDFHFQSGETLAELRIHYRTLGAPRRDEKGVVSNAILILHGT